MSERKHCEDSDFDVKRYREAMNSLHASDDTLMEVLKMADRMEKINGNTSSRAGRGRRSGRRKWKPAGIALVAVLAVCMAAAAVCATDALKEIRAALGRATGEQVESFADAAYGDTSISTSHEYQVSATGSIIVTPDQERVASDSELTAKTIGDYVSDVEATVELGDYTFTFEEFLVDENGIGTLSFVISNPNGVKGWYEAGYGQVCFTLGEEEGAELVEPSFWKYTDGTYTGFYDHKLLYRSDISTETEMHLIAYVGSFCTFEKGDTITMRLRLGVQDEDGRWVPDDEVTEVDFVPEDFIPALTLADADGNQASISAVGLSMEIPDETAYLSECVIRFADGTEYVVKSDDDNADNSVLWYQYGGTLDSDDEIPKSNFAFNRLVDTEEVVSVTLKGTYGTSNEIPFERVFERK